MQLNDTARLSAPHRQRAVLVVAAGLLIGMLLLLARPATVLAAQLSTPELIDQAYAAGVISADQRLLYLAYAVYEPTSLPGAYRSSTPWFGTGAVAELRAALAGGAGEVSAAAATELSQLLHSAAATVCDQDDGSQSLNSANFRLNYETIDGGVTAQRYLDSLEQAFGVEIGSFDWARPPLCTAGVGTCDATNPWGRYPVQVADLGLGLYGYVTSPGGNFTGFVGDNPNTGATEPASLASCMVLNRDYSSFPGGALFALDVTTAHEFVHAIQYGYGDPAPSETPMWYESMAADVEDDVLDDANDNYQYLWPDFENCLAEVPGSLNYSYWPVFRYAEERHGGSVLFRSFWEHVAQGQSATVAYNNALRNQGSTLADTFHAYAISTAFLRACPDSSPYCYVEAAGYASAVGLPATHGSIDGIGNAWSGSVQEYYALEWVELPVTGPYHIDFVADGPLRVSIVAESAAGLDVTELTPDSGADASILYLYTPPAGATRVLAVITNQQDSGGRPVACAATNYTLVAAEPEATAVVLRAPTNAVALPGERVLHGFTVRNVGAEAGSFGLTVTSSAGWADDTAVPISVTLDSGESHAVTVTVNVPSDAPLNSSELTELVAVSLDDDQIVAHGSVRTTARPTAGLVSYLPVIYSPAPKSNVYVVNNMGGGICYEVLNTGIGEQCFPPGAHLYGDITPGIYMWRVSSSPCGTGSGVGQYDAGRVEHEFWCELTVQSAGIK